MYFLSPHDTNMLVRLHNWTLTLPRTHGERTGHLRGGLREQGGGSKHIGTSLMCLQHRWPLVRKPSHGGEVGPRLAHPTHL